MNNSEHFYFQELNLGTQEIMGSTNWEVTASKGIITRTGHVRFFVQYVQAKVVVSQTLDTRNPPHIRDLQLEIGNIQVIMMNACFKNYIFSTTVWLCSAKSVKLEMLCRRFVNAWIQFY